MEFPTRKTIRLKSYDYDSPGYCFITVCTKGKKKLLCDIRSTGSVDDVLVEYTEYGRIVREQMEYMADFYPDIKIDKYVIMPNHVHMILRIISPKGSDGADMKGMYSGVSRFVGSFKRFSNKKCGIDLWQPRSYDHVIRGENDYQEIWTYIEGNPSRWTEDKLYCAE